MSTLNRAIQHKVDVKAHTMSKYLNEDSFTVVSIDNIDFLHSYARVCKGLSRSSWNGTSIQVVQPKPSLEVLNTTTLDAVIAEGVATML